MAREVIQKIYHFIMAREVIQKYTIVKLEHWYSIKIIKLVTLFINRYYINDDFFILIIFFKIIIYFIIFHIIQNNLLNF